MKTLIATTIVTMALCAACAHKDTPQPTTTHEGTPSPVEMQGPSAAEAIFAAAKKHKIKGVIHFTQSEGKVLIEGTLEGLKPGPHGFHIHEKGDCSVADFSSAGGHFNPTNQQHGAAEASEKHLGDLGNIVADKKGKATYKMEIANMKLGGESGIVGKALIIHDKKDDLKTQPIGNAGGRIACSVIEAK